MKLLFTLGSLRRKIAGEPEAEPMAGGETLDPQEELSAYEADAVALEADIDNKTKLLASLRKNIRALQQGLAERDGRAMVCPRRAESFVRRGDLPEADNWRTDNTCSYCGSLNPDWLMERLEAGTVEVEPTDKDYKIYVNNKGGEPWSQGGASKFYFPHLSAAQRTRFVELLNAKALHLGYPGRFYRLPYFISAVDNLSSNG